MSSRVVRGFSPTVHGFRTEFATFGHGVLWTFNTAILEVWFLKMVSDLAWSILLQGGEDP